MCGECVLIHTESVVMSANATSTALLISTRGIGDLGMGARLCAVALTATLCGVPEDRRDGVGIVELPGGDVDH
jgi:hypothetical protein